MFLHVHVYQPILRKEKHDSKLVINKAYPIPCYPIPSLTNEVSDSEELCYNLNYFKI